MRIQLSLNHPGYLSRNGIFNFPQDADDFDITVVADVMDDRVSGIAADNELAIDVLGYSPVISRDNTIWILEGEEPADVDGELRIRITNVIVEEIADSEPEDNEDEVTDATDDEHVGLTFMENEDPIDADDYDENDELLARAAAEARDEQQQTLDQRRYSIEIDLQDQLVGQDLILEFTAGILVNWSRA